MEDEMTACDAQSLLIVLMPLILMRMLLIPEDEHHAIFECSAYATTRQMFSDLFSSHVSTVSQFLNQPDCAWPSF